MKMVLTNVKILVFKGSSSQPNIKKNYNFFDFQGFIFQENTLMITNFVIKFKDEKKKKKKYVEK